MRRTAPVTLLVVALGLWLAAGPGGLTLREILTCSDHPTHHMGGPHHAPAHPGPCFCDQMTQGLDFAVSLAVPTPPASPLSFVVPPTGPERPARVTPPASPAFPPTPPPPDAIG
ncbi:MAG TPA: hypothetical protein VM736_06620 [Gemmatimonadales bacterium]|nr:hypothetical protein [Gemmatimonadales bacterium]